MVLDYKDVSFSFNDRKIKKRKRIFRLSLLAFILIFIVMMVSLFWNSHRVSGVRDLLLAGKYDDAEQGLQSLSSIFHTDSKLELRGLLQLYRGNYREAAWIFARLKGSAVNGREFLDSFGSLALYRELGIYTEFMRADDAQDPELLFYKSQYESALLQADKSEATLAAIPAALKTKYQKAAALVEKNNRRLKTGQVDYIFDINGKPLAYFDTAAGQTVSRVPGISFNLFNQDFAGSLKNYGLTMDSDIQMRLHHAFEGFNGSFLMFNVADGSIVAAYSKPMEGIDQTGENPVFHRLYEPGSIVKLITMTAFLNKFPEENGIFPFQCNGNRKLDGKLFYDWITHGQVKTIDDALAISCNLAFARLGLKLGQKTLENYFGRFFFNQPDIKDLFLSFKTGKTNEHTVGNYQTANLAVGLNQVRMTTFHAALEAQIISQNGSVYAPHLIRTRKNLLDIAYYNHPPQLLDILKDNTAFHKVKNAMVYVVESPDGTGRRSRVDGLQTALKTGTAGSKRDGLDAVIAGYFPAAKPQYAFALRLQRAGKAEWNGAAFLKKFLTSFREIQSGGTIK